MKALASYIMRGRFQALLVGVVAASLMWLVPPFSTVLGELAFGAVIALVTLRNGAREGGLILFGTAAIAAVLALIAVQEGAFAAAMTGAVVVPVLPVLLLAHVLRKTISWGLTLSTAALLGALVVLVVYAATGDPTAFWQARLTAMVEGLHEALNSASGSAELAPADIEQAIATLSRGSEVLAPWMTGLFAVSMLTMFIASLMLGRWWQALLYNPGGWRDEFYALRMPKTLAIASGVLLLATMVLPGIAGQLTADLVFVAGAVYLFPGLAIAHGWVRGKAYAAPALVVLYVLLFIIPHVSVLLAGVGWLDAWVNVRRRVSV